MKRIESLLLMMVVGIGGCGDPGSFGSEPPSFQLSSPPTYAPTVNAVTPPPPLSGGTLIVLHDGNTAVAADPDRDQVSIVDLAGATVRATIALQPGDEPGRVIEDGAGRVHVALRRGGAEVAIDVASGKIVDRRPVCAAPRGIAWQSDGDLIHVACAGGELVTLPAAGGAATRSLLLSRDLRDVIVDGDHLLVSHFKSANLIAINSSGVVDQTLTPAGFQSDNVREGAAFDPAVAWRTVAAPGGGAIMLHQRGLSGVVDVSADVAQSGGSAYGSSSGGGSCDDGIVHATVTRLGRNGAQQGASPIIPGAVVPLDVALSPDSSQLTVVAAGNYLSADSPQVITVSISDFDGSITDCAPTTQMPITGQAIAVAYQPNGTVVVQTREPPTVVAAQVIALSGGSRDDTGHEVFHLNAGAGIACASCHPEGGEDGRVWTFSDSGQRRTQSPRGGLLGTEPFHWDGNLANLDDLMSEVFVTRMGGTKLAPDQLAALSQWLDKDPLLPTSPPSDAAAVQRGSMLFDSAGCTGCHSGAKLTNNQTMDVGTGGAFQVPTLFGVGFRAPFLHDGCAATLADRFGPCGGTSHGATSTLTPAQISDLVSFLETL